MNALQAWLLIGIPALALSVALFYGRSPVRSMLGYLVVLAAFAGLTVVHRASGAIFGGAAALLYAAGRGGAAERAATHPNEEGVPDAALHPRRRRGAAATP